MSTFLHRLCLFGLLATTGFALSNCARSSDRATTEASADRAGIAADTDEYTADTEQLGTGGAGDAGMGMTRMDAGMMRDAGMGMTGMTGDTRMNAMPDAGMNTVPDAGMASMRGTTGTMKPDAGMMTPDAGMGAMRRTGAK